MNGLTEGLIIARTFLHSLHPGTTVGVIRVDEGSTERKSEYRLVKEPKPLLLSFLTLGYHTLLSFESFHSALSLSCAHISPSLSSSLAFPSPSFPDISLSLSFTFNKA